MKLKTKTLSTLTMLAFFLFMALSTSLPEDKNSHHELRFINTDEKCYLHDFSFQFIVDSVKLDSFKASWVIWPKDSVIDFYSKERRLVQVSYRCDCSYPDAIHKLIKYRLDNDTSAIKRIRLSCK